MNNPMTPRQRYMNDPVFATFDTHDHLTTPKTPAPELHEGWYYWHKQRHELMCYDGDGIGIAMNGQEMAVTASEIRPATLDDLAGDARGVKVWVVDHGNNNIELLAQNSDGEFNDLHFNNLDERPVSRYIAEKCEWPIIKGYNDEQSPSQWDVLTKDRQ